MKIINKILLFLLIAVSGYSLSWQYDGTNITASQALNFDITLDLSNNMYVLYADISNAYKLNFLLLSNFVWTNLTTNFTPNQALQMKLLWNTNSYSYGPYSYTFLNYITNYSPNLTIFNSNFVTNITTNSIDTNFQSYPITFYTGTNITGEPLTVFIDRGKLYKASFMAYNGATWSTNYRGFTSHPVSMFDALFNNSLVQVNTNISHIYTVYNTNIISTINYTWTNTFFPVILTNTFSFSYTYLPIKYSNDTTINGLDYGLWSTSVAHASNVFYYTNTVVNLSVSNTTNWITNFVNSLIQTFQYIDAPAYAWLYYDSYVNIPYEYALEIAPGAGSIGLQTFYVTNVYTNTYLSNLVVSTNTVTTIFTNTYTNSYSNIIVSDNPYLTILYSDSGFNYKANVLQLSNNTWNFLGVTNGFSTSTIEYPSLCQDTNNYWYAGYQDTGLNFQGHVMKYTNSGYWFSPSGGYNITNKADYTVLKSYNGNLFFAFDDLMSHSLNVYEYTNGGRWFPVGNANISSGRALYVNMSIWTNGNITVAYADGSTNYRLSVLQYTNSGNWFYLGKAISNPIYNLKMILNTNGQPVIIYSDIANSGKLSVLEYR